MKNLFRTYSCRCEDSDNDSETSNCPSEDKTCVSDKSTCTCYCSKNESHIDLFNSDTEGTIIFFFFLLWFFFFCYFCTIFLVCDENKFPNGMRPERIRGGFGLIKPKHKILSIDKDEKSLNNDCSQNEIVDPTQVSYYIAIIILRYYLFATIKYV